MQASSFMHGEDAVDFRDRLAMLETIGENSKRECFGFRDRLVTSGAVSQNAWEIGHFADPATVVLALDLKCEVTHRYNRTTAAGTGVRSRPFCGRETAICSFRVRVTKVCQNS